MPLSVVSTRAISDACDAIRSARRRSSFPRDTGVVRDQSTNASRAARTASSTSDASARGTVAHGCPRNGLTLSNRFPERASTHSPPINIR